MTFCQILLSENFLYNLYFLTQLKPYEAPHHSEYTLLFCTAWRHVYIYVTFASTTHRSRNCNSNNNNIGNNCSRAKRRRCCCPTCNQFATSRASLLTLLFVGSDGSRRELSLDLGLGLWVSRRRRRGHAHHSGSKAAALTPYFGAAGKVRPWRSTLTRFLAECSECVCLPACMCVCTSMCVCVCVKAYFAGRSCFRLLHLKCVRAAFEISTNWNCNAILRAIFALSPSHHLFQRSVCAIFWDQFSI